MSREGQRGKRQNSSNTRTKFDVELPKINKTVFSIRDIKDRQSTMFTSAVTNYSQKTSWVIEPVDYTQCNDYQIQNEYKKLRRQLQYINQQVLKAVQKAQLKSTKKVKMPEPQSARILEIRDKQVQNSNAIIQRLQKQYNQLQKKVLSLSTISKDNIEEEINESKQKITKIKTKIKELKHKNKVTGSSIMNSDQVFDQIRRLESERDMMERKKLKLQNKNEQVYESIASSELKLEDISDSYLIAENYFQEYHNKEKVMVQNKELEQKYRHLKYCFEVNNKKNQIVTNTKQQKYHIALKNLQNEIERIGNTNEKSNLIELNIIEAKKTITELESLVNNWSFQESNHKLVEEPLFFTEFEDKEKQNQQDEKVEQFKKQEKQEIKIVSEEIIEENNEKEKDNEESEEKYEKKQERPTITERIDTNMVDPEEQKDVIMDLDEKFLYKGKSKIKNDTQTEIDQKSEIEDSYQNSEDTEIVDFKTKITQNKIKLSEKKQFNIDLSSIEDNIKKMDSMQLNKHEVIRKSKENIYD